MLTPRLRAFFGRLASRPSATVELADVPATLALSETNGGYATAELITGTLPSGVVLLC